MGTAKMVIPVSDLGWEDEDTRVVEDVPMPSLAVPPLGINRTTRLEKVDPALLERARTSLPPKKRTSLPPKKRTSLLPGKARPLPPRPGLKSDASVTPKPTPPRPLAVKPFVHRPFAIPAPLPRARPGLPTAVAKSAAEVVPSLFAMDLEATSPFAAKVPVDEPAPPSSRSFGTIPAPPPSMTGAIIVDEKMFEEAVGGRIHMTGASLIPSNIDLGIVIEPTGTIDVDETWLEDEDIVEQDIEPESFWLRGKR